LEAWYSGDGSDRQGLEAWYGDELRRSSTVERLVLIISAWDSVKIH
jgi:hypothetical protein